MSTRFTMRLFVLCFCVLAFGAVVSCNEAAEDRPNVLLILVDDLKPSLGAYGDQWVHSPNIDRLAARGMRFDMAYCNQAVCAPSRNNLLLGSRSTSIGVYSLGYHFRRAVPDAVTMPQYFKQHGYHAAGIGKVFHIGHGNINDEQSWSVPFQPDQVIDYVLPESTGGKLTREEALFSNRPAGGLPRGAAWENADVDDDAYADGRIAAAGIERLQNYKQSGQPFFLALGFTKPHLPFCAPKKYWELYDRQSLPVSEQTSPPIGAPRYAGKTLGELNQYKPVPNDPPLSNDLIRTLVHGYYASLSYMDAQVGRVLDEVDRLGLADNTIIVLWGDHGYHLGDHGMWTKHTNYEQAVRIPIIVSAPGVTRPGASCGALIETVDLFPTIVELAGLPAPTGPQPIDGESFAAVLQGRDSDVGQYAYHCYPRGSRLGRAMRTQRYRLVQWAPFGGGEAPEYELYDYQSDPLETKNLAAERPDVVKQLAELLAAQPPAKPRHRSSRQRFTAANNQAQGGAAPEIVDRWKYTVRRPGEGWMLPEFDDSGWKEGNGGFGSPGTPAARIGVGWYTNNIWLRKSFEVGAIPEKPALLIHHDEDTEVYINGKRVAQFRGYTVEYKVVALAEEHHSALKEGKNLMAVHCRQTGGGQFIDVHLVDADNVSQLPPAKRDTTPFQSELITRWGAEVTPENAWTEYPRPQLVRDNWQNLNGNWDYAITPDNQAAPPDTWSGKILVPFSLESRLGGVQRLLEPNEALWYRRTFRAAPRDRGRTLLNFEAVDYACRVFVNGETVGFHKGGNTPFSLDVTSALRSGDNELIVRVEDDTEEWQLRGKQVLNPRGIWYTQVSGIWQTVWLEQVGPSHIEDLTIQTDAASGEIKIRPEIAGEESAKTIRIVVKDGGEKVTEAAGRTSEFSIIIEDAKLWSPDSPHLYDLEVTLLDAAGNVVDRVTSYAGIRTVGKTRDQDGHWRFTLNGETIFHWGPLDQGWWPDGLLTPPSDEAMLYDVEYLKAAGFNMIRKHIKVEPRRYYYHCDRLGMMVWQDQVSAGHNPPWTRLRPNPSDAQWPDEHHQQFMVELQRMIDTLEGHPSIVVWVPFNEAWGQHRTMEVGRWTAQRDPSRLVNVASGGNFWPAGDVVDHHSYPHPDFPFDAERDKGFIKVVGEFGGHGFPVQGHLWDAERRNWGYGGLPMNKAEYRERYETSLRMLNELRGRGIAAGVYTQTTDVEGEINGLLTYDRKEVKIPAEQLKAISRVLFE